MPLEHPEVTNPNLQAILNSLGIRGVAVFQLSDVLVPTFDLGDLQGLPPRRVVLATGQGSALVSGDIWASNALIYQPAVGNFQFALFVGGGPFTRLDWLTFSYVADLASAAGTSVDVWRTDDGVGGDPFINLVTQITAPSNISSTGFQANGDPDTGSFGTNQLRLRRGIPHGALPAGTSFAFPGDLVASVGPALSGVTNKRIGVSIRNTALVSPWAAAVNIRWQATIRIVL